MIPSIAYPLSLSWPEATPLFYGALLLSLLCAVLAIRLILANPWRLVRPALVFAALLNVLFQWPSVLLAEAFANDLPNVLLFYAAIHVTPLLLVVWIYLSPRLDVVVVSNRGATFTRFHFAVPLFVLGAAAFLFLVRMPFDCTALFAMLAEPAMTMLAREFTIKFANSTLATTSYGALINTVAPVVIALALWQVLQAVRHRRPTLGIIWLMMIVITAGLVLLSGAKGNLIPSFLVGLAAAVGWGNSLRSRAMVTCSLVLVLVGCLVMIEIAKERPMGGGGLAYDFPMCTKRLDTCSQSTTLVASLKRDEALGLTREQIADISDRLVLLCHTDTTVSEVKVTPRILVASLNLSDRGQSQVSTEVLLDRKRYLDIAQAGELTIAPSVQYGPIADRIAPYISSIGYRAFVIPIQVASWHYLYVAENGMPGLPAMPLGKRLTGGEVINMPEVVYQAYGSFYSGGDVTSTSTAPTGFALAYPAYLGAHGIALVVALIVAFDAVFMLLSKRLGRLTLPLAAGLAAVSAMNFILSDYLTTLLSHGALAAVGLVGIFALIEKYSPSKSADGDAAHKLAA